MVKRSYKQFCPAARSLDVIGERWTLLIARDLLRGPRRYTDLRNGLPGMASNLLAQRLGEMETAGLIRREHRTDPEPRDVYVLTDRGLELKPVLMAIGRFGLAYLDEPAADDEVDPAMFPEGLATMLLVEELPDGVLSIRFALDDGDFTLRITEAGPPGQRRPASERVSARPGTDGPTDVTIAGSMAALVRVRQGEISAGEALDQGLLGVEGAADASAAAGRLYGFERAPA